MTSERRIKRFGWQPDAPDPRDHIFSIARPRALVRKVDLRPFCPPVVDQGNLGSCTANAIAAAVDFVTMRATGKFVGFSRLMIYYNERVIEHTVDQDAGAMIRDGVKSVAKLGVCSERKWPYKVSRFTAKPSPGAYVEALEHTVSSYQRITSLVGLRTSLADGFPVVFGFTVFESFMDDEVARTGVVNYPDVENEGTVGGHAVLAVGYDDDTQRVLVRNSWSDKWGMQGHFTLPYAYFTRLPHLASDLWTIRK